MTRTQLLRLIGNGRYDSEIPANYSTSKMLFQCMADGLVGSKHLQNDDFFFLTERGKSASQIDDAEDAA